MVISPLIVAATLTINLQGLSVITPWRSPAEGFARVWVFYPTTSQRVPAHRVTLMLPQDAVVADDWRPDSTDGPSGIWKLEGYVLSVYRDGVKEAPDQLLTWRPGKEGTAWEGLRFVLDLTRVVPQGRIAQNPFANGRAIAAVKLSDGDLDAELKDRGQNRDIWEVRPATNPPYKQPFTDTVRYRVDLKDAATELRLDPVPGGNQPPKRIRLTSGPGREVVATVAHLPQQEMKGVNHAPSAGAVFAAPADGQIAKISVIRTNEIGGDPLCDSAVFQLRTLPTPPNCIRCAIDLSPATAVQQRR